MARQGIIHQALPEPGVGNIPGLASMRIGKLMIIGHLSESHSLCRKLPAFFIFGKISPKIMIAQMKFADNVQFRTIDGSIDQAQIELGRIQPAGAAHLGIWKFMNVFHDVTVSYFIWIAIGAVEEILGRTSLTDEKNRISRTYPITGAGPITSDTAHPASGV